MATQSCSCAFFEMRIENDIVIIQYSESIVDLSVMKRMRDCYLEISDGSSYPILADGRKVKYWTKEARNFQLEMEDPKIMKAAAILAKHKVQEVFFNFFLNFSTPKIPVKLFSDKEKAIKWLREKKGS